MIFPARAAAPSAVIPPLGNARFTSLSEPTPPDCARPVGVRGGPITRLKFLLRSSVSLAIAMLCRVWPAMR